MARARNSGSSLPWYFSWIAFTDSASMRACAGSYTPQGRSQCAWTTRRGLSNASTIRIMDPPFTGPSGETYHRVRKATFRLATVVALLAVARLRPFRVAVEGD